MMSAFWARAARGKKMETISARVGRILKDLGESADQVARALKAQGIQGVRNTVRTLNPIVRFVQKSLLLSNLGMDVINPKAFRIILLDGSQVETALPPAIREFLDVFDQGGYPDLEMAFEKPD